MSDVENKQDACAANCPMNRLILVHEIGYKDHVYCDDSSCSWDTVAVPLHLVEYKNERRHHFLLHAIKEIGGFDLPVFEFKKVRKPGILGLLGFSTVEYTKVKDVSGGWIRLYDGKLVLVSETYEELKELIEGGGEKKDATHE